MLYDSCIIYCNHINSITATVVIRVEQRSPGFDLFVWSDRQMINYVGLKQARGRRTREGINNAETRDPDSVTFFLTVEANGGRFEKFFCVLKEYLDTFQLARPVVIQTLWQGCGECGKYHYEF